MKINIRKKAKQFAKHNMHYTIDCEMIMSYINSVGYTIVFYTMDNPNDIITGYGLTEFSKTVNAFTYHRRTEKFVFLRSDLTEEKKLYALLHEIAHIVLGHMNNDRIPKHKRFEEMEAEAFAYTVLQSKPTNHIIWVVFGLCIALCLSIGFGIYFNYANNYADNSDSHSVPVVHKASAPAQRQPETVYITPTGRKFHRSSCGYVQNKNCASLSRSEAEKNYEPCAVCNP